MTDTADNSRVTLRDVHAVQVQLLEIQRTLGMEIQELRREIQRLDAQIDRRISDEIRPVLIRTAAISGAIGAVLGSAAAVVSKALS